jgi:cardiolipin synthase
LVAGLTLFISVLGSGHAILYKRDSRAAVLWVGFIWLVPLVGAVLYFLLGVNRIRRRALSLRGDLQRYQSDTSVVARTRLEAEVRFPEDLAHLGALNRLIGQVVTRPLVPGNRVTPLVNGEEAYPAMLEAIRAARRSVAFCTYIFDNDTAGRMFTEALEGAVRRGVEVRMLIDDTGARYSWPSIVRLLRRKRIPVARFLPTVAPWRMMGMNMRNHRKILVVDGAVGFTGGMNVRAGHLLKSKSRHPVQDLQFQVEGPVVAHLQEAFADDWFFTTREALRGEKWFPPLEPKGEVIARGIVDGPDEDFEKLRWTILGALSCAQRSVRIVTPYFLPDQSIISALNVAALRGVAVDIVLPSKNNLPIVQWASGAVLWQMLERGCRIWFTPPPFDHSKIMLVDDYWALVGSANWDPRSLRLNFEFNLECHNREFALRLLECIQAKLRSARQVTLEEMDRRSLPVKLRDGVARLLAPFL